MGWTEEIEDFVGKTKKERTVSEMAKYKKI